MPFIQSVFLSGAPQFQYQKENPPSSQSWPFLVTGFIGTAALIGWLAVFFLVQKLGVLVKKITLYHNHGKAETHKKSGSEEKGRGTCKGTSTGEGKGEGRKDIALKKKKKHCNIEIKQKEKVATKRK